ENTGAIKSYERCGFSIYTTFHCYKLINFRSEVDTKSSGVSIRQISKPNWAVYESFGDTSPYFLDSTSILNQNIEHEHLAEARIGVETVGYIIFQPQVSRLSQIAVDKSRRGQGIGKALLAYALNISDSKTLTILNVDQGQSEIINTLH